MAVRTGIAKSGKSPSAGEQSTHEKCNSDRVQRSLSRPTGQAIKGRTWLPPCFDGVRDRLSGLFDRLRSCLDCLLSLFELAWRDILQWFTFANHLSSLRQCVRSTPLKDNRSKAVECPLPFVGDIAGPVRPRNLKLKF
jgi:hypothetical protein